MSSTSLAVYLRDHLAGSAAAVEILRGLRDEHADEPLGRFASDLLIEVERDRVTLETLIERIGGGTSALKETTAWLAAKLSRFKLGRELSDELGVLEALEVVALGILGKRALWDSLSMIGATDARLRGLDLPTLIEHAMAQHARVEKERLKAARSALS
jgi:hypothetical protein